MSNIVLQTLLCTTLAFALHLVASVKWGNLPRSVCLVVASMHHFFLLTTFAWLALAAFIFRKNIEWPLNWILKWAHKKQDVRNRAIAK